MLHICWHCEFLFLFFVFLVHFFVYGYWGEGYISNFFYNRDYSNLPNSVKTLNFVVLAQVYWQIHDPMAIYLPWFPSPPSPSLFAGTCNTPAWIYRATKNSTVKISSLWELHNVGKPLFSSKIPTQKNWAQYWVKEECEVIICALRN